jgi:isopentenyldiphosphate isomerase
MGENQADGVREMEEELGVKVSFDDLIPLGVVKQKKVEPEYIDNEFSYLYLYESNLPLEDYKISHEEVEALVKVELKEFQRLIEEKVFEIEISGVSVNNFNIKQTIEIKINKKDLVPHGDDYYKLVCSSAIKYFK